MKEALGVIAATTSVATGLAFAVLCVVHSFLPGVLVPISLFCGLVAWTFAEPQ